jgi:23S rRNA pseudouridine2457 synthase
MILAFHKPYGVLSQFSPDGSQNRTLAEFGFPKGVYPIGRLDADSEGLLLLSDEAGLNTRLLDPKFGHTRCYWAQIERIPTVEALETLAAGISIQDQKTKLKTKTRSCRVWLLDPQPDIPHRDPPIRIRKSVPDCWVALELAEGKNRQVRRMTAAIGHPTLRLIRMSISNFLLGDIASGTWRECNAEERRMIFEQP